MTQHTKDFGDEIICRAHHIKDGKPVPGEIVCRGGTIEVVRNELLDKYPSLYKLGREPVDDPVIIESWM